MKEEMNAYLQRRHFSVMSCMITSNTYIGKIYMIGKQWFVPYA